MAKKSDERKAAQLQEVKDLLACWNFDNAKEIQEAYLSKELVKDGLINQFGKINRSLIKKHLNDNNIFDRNSLVIDYVVAIDGKLATHIKNARQKQQDDLSKPDGETDKEVSFVASRSVRELNNTIRRLERDLEKVRSERDKLKEFYDKHHDTLDFLEEIEANPNTLF